MALDEPKETDEIFTESGMTFAIDKQLLEQVKPVAVDFIETEMGSGYRISGNLPNSCGSCRC